MDRCEGTWRISVFLLRLHGEPIRIDGLASDGRWFCAIPETVVEVDGDKAEQLIPKLRSVVESYKFRAYGDYRPWPGPNSNTFIQAILTPFQS
jgi:hypothetical protein